MLLIEGMQVGSLFRKLGSHMPPCMAKKKERKKEIDLFSLNAFNPMKLVLLGIKQLKKEI